MAHRTDIFTALVELAQLAQEIHPELRSATINFHREGYLRLLVQVPTDEIVHELAERFRLRLKEVVSGDTRWIDAEAREGKLDVCVMGPHTEVVVSAARTAADENGMWSPSHQERQ